MASNEEDHKLDSDNLLYTGGEGEEEAAEDVASTTEPQQEQAIASNGDVNTTDRMPSTTSTTNTNDRFGGEKKHDLEEEEEEDQGTFTTDTETNMPPDTDRLTTEGHSRSDSLVSDYVDEEEEEADLTTLASHHSSPAPPQPQHNQDGDPGDLSPKVMTPTAVEAPPVTMSSLSRGASSGVRFNANTKEPLHRPGGSFIMKRFSTTSVGLETTATNATDYMSCVSYMEEEDEERAAGDLEDDQLTEQDIIFEDIDLDNDDDEEAVVAAATTTTQKQTQKKTRGIGQRSRQRRAVEGQQQQERKKRKGSNGVGQDGFTTVIIIGASAKKWRELPQDVLLRIFQFHGPRASSRRRFRINTSSICISNNNNNCYYCHENEDASGLAKLALVCRAWRAASEQNSLWEDLCRAVSRHPLPHMSKLQQQYFFDDGIASVRPHSTRIITANGQVLEPGTFEYVLDTYYNIHKQELKYKDYYLSRRKIIAREKKIDREERQRILRGMIYHFIFKKDRELRLRGSLFTLTAAFVFVFTLFAYLKEVPLRVASSWGSAGYLVFLTKLAADSLSYNRIFIFLWMSFLFAFLFALSIVLPLKESADRYNPETSPPLTRKQKLARLLAKHLRIRSGGTASTSTTTTPIPIPTPPPPTTTRANGREGHGHTRTSVAWNLLVTAAALGCALLPLVFSILVNLRAEGVLSPNTNWYLVFVPLYAFLVIPIAFGLVVCFSRISEFFDTSLERLAFAVFPLLLATCFGFLPNYLNHTTGENLVWAYMPVPVHSWRSIVWPMIPLWIAESIAVFVFIKWFLETLSQVVTVPSLDIASVWSKLKSPFTRSTTAVTSTTTTTTTRTRTRTTTATAPKRPPVHVMAVKNNRRPLREVITARFMGDIVGYLCGAAGFGLLIAFEAMLFVRGDTRTWALVPLLVAEVLLYVSFMCCFISKLETQV